MTITYKVLLLGQKLKIAATQTNCCAMCTCKKQYTQNVHMWLHTKLNQTVKYTKPTIITQFSWIISVPQHHSLTPHSAL
jgi:hypothetical protein